MAAISAIVWVILIGSPMLVAMLVGFFGVQRFAIDASTSRSWCVASLFVLALGIALIALVLQRANHQNPLIFSFFASVAIAGVGLGALNFVLMRLSQEHGFWIAVLLTLIAVITVGALSSVVLWTASHG